MPYCIVRKRQTSFPIFSLCRQLLLIEVEVAEVTRHQRLCSCQKFKCEWELDVSLLPTTAPYTTVRPTNERAATPQTFLMTFIPPHFPSTETPTNLTWPHPDDYHSPQHGPSSLPSPYLHHPPQSVISCQAPSGPRLFSASCSIRMQQAINAIRAWGRPSATADPQPQYLWCHQIKGGQGAIIVTPTLFVLYLIIFAFEIYLVFICFNPPPPRCLKEEGGAKTTKCTLMLNVMQMDRTGFTVNK